jgi:hypothetical protein
MDMDELQAHLDKYMFEQNNRSIPEFEGYSPSEMHNILFFTFEENSPISLQKLTDSEYHQIPMFKQFKYFIDLLKKTGEIKLTAKGNLPLKIVKDIHAQGFFEEEMISTSRYYINKEDDAITVNLTRLLAQLAKITKKRNNKLSLTKVGEKLDSNSQRLFETIFKTMARRFKWAYYDGFGDNDIGQMGYGFSLILLHKYGNKKRIDTFYAEKYFLAFPDIMVYPNFKTIKSPEHHSYSCYSLRTFTRFLNYFGLTKTENVEDRLDSDQLITKSDLFDKLIKVRPHSINEPVKIKRS